MDLNLIVILIYTLLMIVVGYIGMRRAKNKDDYLVAGRNLGPIMYVGTFAAVVLGGASTIGTVQLGYLYGISGIWLTLAIGIGIILVSTFLVKPLIKLKVYTVTHVLEGRYNPAAKTASGIIMLLYDLMVAVTSTIAIGSIMQVMFKMDPWIAILVGGSVVIFYSTIGGMWSLTMTDIVQFIIMTVGMMFILLPSSISASGGWDNLTQALPTEYFSLTNIGIDTIVTYILIYTLGIMIGQDVWQRIFTARSPKVAQYGGIATGLYCITWGIVGAIIGMAGKIVLIGPFNAQDTFALMVQTVLPNGWQGLVIAAALAALMSTASACLLASSTVFTQDIFPAISKIKAENISLATNRKFTALMGIVMLGLSFIVNDVIAALTVAYNLLVGGMLLPLLAAIFWKRATTQGAIASMLLGATFVLIFMLKDGLAANTPIYYGLSASLLSITIVSLMTQPVEAKA